MTEAEKAYSEHWGNCSDCRHQTWCEVGYGLRQALREEGE